MLVAGRNYQLSFDTYNQGEVASSTVYVIVDNNTVFNYTTLNFFNFSYASTSFIAGGNLTQICFDFSAVLNPYAVNVGACLDNITLIELAQP